jgi:hypothetical protein
MSYAMSYEGFDRGLLVEEPFGFFSCLGSEDPRHSENPYGNPCPLRARLYLVSLTLLDARGNTSEKRGIRAGTDERSPAGIDAVTFSDVTGAESGRGCALGRGWVQGGVFLAGLHWPGPHGRVAVPDPAGRGRLYTQEYFTIYLCETADFSVSVILLVTTP